MTHAIEVRPRREDDLADLTASLLEQQPQTRYPVRNPLPFPVSDFLHFDDAVAAWTATIDGTPVGHISTTRSHTGVNGGDELQRACAQAHGCAVEDLVWLSAFFVGTRARGLGLGRTLLHTAVDDIRRAGGRPSLEVVPAFPAALRLYESTGWSEVLRTRPEWLASAADSDGLEVVVMVLL
ncbi:ribosomal protein S18 acetylase RimI-like enzyme [Nocardioides albertanoniae]|uniref:Ribosomal protein S18 acetylase RimI-like enzyme n=1 Tax=Nocardioides albertanoniae TaxID=1175486 RepID=A0A543A7M6_9ACTN|nr:GNAT family N-acetyltransferase [Nocardioides albertanoniae]TQL68520.1 ribosomal protein S18 acetylase RimI-like enzyme [Nocardioides albertanoniae]